MKNNICVGGFVVKDEKFLFGKRSEKKSWAPGVWDIVGGHALKHEDVYDALKRETLEEIGIIIKSAELLTITDVMDDSKNKTFKYYIYVITEWEAEPKNCSDEHTEIRWFPRNELENLPLALHEYLTLIDNWILSVSKLASKIH